ncbi:MAG: hypothetical protein AB8B91_05255 [Rubripirellula sp.]
MTIDALNDACRTYVVPIGRHSLMGSRWQGDLAVGGDQQNVSVFVSALKSMFRRIELVGAHAVEAIDANCTDKEVEGPRPNAGAYLAALQDDPLLRPRRLHQLMERLQVPESILCRIVPEQST